MGGAVTNIAAVAHGMTTYDPDVIQGSVLERTELGRQLELYRTLPADERRSIPGLQPKRADVILAGACVVASVMDALGADRLTVSDRGLRHGVLATRFGVTRDRNGGIDMSPPLKARRPASGRRPASAGDAPAASHRLTDAQVGEVLKLIRGRRQRRAQGDRAGRPAPGDDPGPARSTRSRRSRGRSTSSTPRTWPSTAPAWSSARVGRRAGAATR